MLGAPFCRLLRLRRSLSVGVSHCLREGHELLVWQLQGASELWIVDRSPKDRGEPLRGAEQIDVLADEAGIDRGVEAALLGRDIRHALAMSDIDEVERRGGDKILKAGLSTDIVLQMMMWTASPQRHHSAKAWSQERHKEGDRP